MKKTDNPNYQKEWRIDHPNYGKEHYQNNKEKYLAKVACPHCGKITFKSNLRRHQKSHLCVAVQPTPMPTHFVSVGVQVD